MPSGRLAAHLRMMTSVDTHTALELLCFFEADNSAVSHSNQSPCPFVGRYVAELLLFYYLIYIYKVKFNPFFRHKKALNDSKPLSAFYYLLAINFP